MDVSSLRFTLLKTREDGGLSGRVTERRLILYVRTCEGGDTKTSTFRRFSISSSSCCPEIFHKHSRPCAVDEGRLSQLWPPAVVSVRCAPSCCLSPLCVACVCWLPALGCIKSRRRPAGKKRRRCWALCCHLDFDFQAAVGASRLDVVLM